MAYSKSLRNLPDKLHNINTFPPQKQSAANINPNVRFIPIKKLSYFYALKRKKSNPNREKIEKIGKMKGGQAAKAIRLKDWRAKVLVLGRFVGW